VAGVTRIALDRSGAGRPLPDWLAGAQPFLPVPFDPDAAFNIIYSSGTTGRPKGIVQPNRMRWAHVRRCVAFGYTAASVTIVSTPIYSNTTLVNFVPALALGGTVVLQTKFDAFDFLRLSELHRATHATLVPVQFERVLRAPEFDTFDLCSFQMKFSTGAHLSAAIEREILDRWPGGLFNVYGMTEGGGTCLLAAHLHQDKLHTVGRPAAGHEFHVIDDAGRVLRRGEVGEIVGRSPSSMMTGYHRAPELTALVEWHDAKGQRYIRTGDLGSFDEDGFLVLAGRKKDVIISGGFNIYAIDLETVLAGHPAVFESAVVGVASPEWGETPVAFVVLRPGLVASPDELRSWANARLGKTQRISRVELTAELPRSAIGKVLKRDLRENRCGDQSTVN
jgi:long-chain acyl-CoA synthetase